MTSTDLADPEKLRELAIEEIVMLCEHLHRGRPDNRHKDNPIASYQAGVCKVMWEIRALLRAPTSEKAEPKATCRWCGGVERDDLQPCPVCSPPVIADTYRTPEES